MQKSTDFVSARYKFFLAKIQRSDNYKGIDYDYDDVLKYHRFMDVFEDEDGYPFVICLDMYEDRVLFSYTVSTSWTEDMEIYNTSTGLEELHFQQSLVHDLWFITPELCVDVVNIHRNLFK